MPDFVRGKPVVDAGAKPSFKQAIEYAPVVAFEHKDDHVIRTWIVNRRTRAEQVAAIKAEASRRIDARFPAWKQSNMMARMIELKSAATLSVEEQVEADAIGSVWAWIKKIRVRSNEFEAMSELPRNYDEDQSWPE